MGSIFGRLGYNFNDPSGAIKPYANSVVDHLKTMPPILEDWQYEDIANANTNGYFVNPVSQTVSNMITLMSGISSDANGNTLLSAIETECSNTSSIAQQFIAHTDRLSGVTNFEQSNGAIDLALEDKPFLLTALGVGTTLSYMTYQYDGVSNTATSLGSFTSLLIKENLDDLAIELNEYAEIVNNSISISPTPPYTKTTSLTSAQISEIDSFLSDLGDVLSERIEHDENFYANSLMVLSDYDKVDFFSTSGQTKDTLIDGYIGSDKIKQRLNA